MKTKLQRKRQQPHAHYDKKSGLVRLNVPLSIKASAIDLANHTFEGLAAVWNLDLGNDVIKKGAFKKSISDWRGGPDPIPLLNSHDHYDIFAALGQAIDLKETGDGLWSKWELLPTPESDAVLARLMPSKTTGKPTIGKMSIGFEPVKFSYEQPDGTNSFFDRIRHLEVVNLKEVSLVLFPMAPGASIDATTVKMFLKAAHQTDPRSLDSMTRLELRRLNSKIGLLLQKQRPEGDDDPQDDEEDSQKSSTSHSAKKSTSSAQRKNSDDEAEDSIEDLSDDEELEDLSDDSGDEELDDESTDESTDDDASDEEADDEEATDDESDTTESGKSQDSTETYAYAEALAQRLRSVTLKHKVSEIGKDS